MRPTFIIALAFALASCGPEPKTLSAEPFNTNIPLDEVMAHVMDPAAYAFWGGTGTSYTIDSETDLSPKTEAVSASVSGVGALSAPLGAAST